MGWKHSKNGLKPLTAYCLAHFFLALAFLHSLEKAQLETIHGYSFEAGSWEISLSKAGSLRKGF